MLKIMLRKPVTIKTYQNYAKHSKPEIVAVYNAVVDASAAMNKSGRALVTLCPFHDDTKPSFALYEDTNSAYCFSCGWKGDAYNLVMEHLDCDFKDALRYLTQHNL